MEAESSRVFIFDRREVQVRALIAIAREWEGRFWPLDEVFRAVERPGSLVLFAAPRVDEPQWDGVALVDVGPYSAELLYIYVSAAKRRAGIGAALFAGLLDELAKRRQVEDLFLEVRVSNDPARRMYESFGLERVGERRKYYSDGEDALVYRYRFERATGAEK